MKAAILTMLLPLLAGSIQAEETNTPPAPTSATSNVTPSSVTSNVAPSTITIDGTTYEEVRWGRLTPSTVTIFHKTGVATIALAKLPPELQKRFGYDPQRAAAWQTAEQKSAAARAKVERQQALLSQYGAKKINPAQVGAIGKLGSGWTVLQVLDTSRMLIRGYIRPDPMTGSGPSFTSPFCLQGFPTSNYTDGQNLQLDWTGMVVKVTHTMTYDSTEGAQRTIFVIEPYDGN